MKHSSNIPEDPAGHSRGLGLVRLAQSNKTSIIYALLRQMSRARETKAYRTGVQLVGFACMTQRELRRREIAMSSAPAGGLKMNVYLPASGAIGP